MELSKYEPRRLVSLARGVTEPSGWVAGVEYREADLRDRAAVDRVLAEVRPSTVYHVAAQRDPGAAEAAVHRTLTTNVLGTQNVVAAAQRHEVGRLVYGSTGKAMRPYTRDTYAASKKVGEWLLGAASHSGMSCAAARFTHVVDNSIIRRRLGDWIADGSPIRLHAPDIVFYVQSARESAQLLLTAGLEAEPGRFSIHVINDLGYPIDLLDLAVGANLAMGRLSPVFLCGFEPGYQERAYPAVFDPAVSPDFSALLNGFESAMAGRSATTAGVDRFALRVTNSARIRLRLRALDRACTASEGPSGHAGGTRRALVGHARRRARVLARGHPPPDRRADGARGRRRDGRARAHHECGASVSRSVAGRGGRNGGTGSSTTRRRSSRSSRLTGSDEAAPAEQVFQRLQRMDGGGDVVVELLGARVIQRRGERCSASSSGRAASARSPGRGAAAGRPGRRRRGRRARARPAPAPRPSGARRQAPRPSGRRPTMRRPRCPGPGRASSPPRAARALLAAARADRARPSSAVA